MQWSQPGAGSGLSVAMPYNALKWNARMDSSRPSVTPPPPLHMGKPRNQTRLLLSVAEPPSPVTGIQVQVHSRSTPMPLQWK